MEESNKCAQVEWICKHNEHRKRREALLVALGMQYFKNMRSALFLSDLCLNNVQLLVRRCLKHAIEKEELLSCLTTQ